MAKRAFDLVFAGLALVACGPPLLVIAVLVKILTKGPLPFRDQKEGLHSRPLAAGTYAFPLRDTHQYIGMPHRTQCNLLIQIASVAPPHLLL